MDSMHRMEVASASSSMSSSSRHSIASASASVASKSACSYGSTLASSLYDSRPITTLDRRLYLAVDCGGTKAAAVISDQDGQVVARGFGGPANFTDVGLDDFLLSVQQAIRQALGCCSSLQSTSSSSSSAAAAGRGGRRRGERGSLSPGVAGRAEPLFEAAWFGIAGVDSDVDVQQLTPYLATLLSLPYPSNRLMVANDTSLLAAPVRDTDDPEIRSGVVVIAGTGSIVMSFKADEGGMLQTLGRVGGFGWLLGDEGSGYWVGRDALRFVLDQADRDRLGGTCMFGDEIVAKHPVGSRQDVYKKHDHLLRDRILELWNLGSTDELFNAIYSSRPPGQPRTPALRSGQISPPEGADGTGAANVADREGDEDDQTSGRLMRAVAALMTDVGNDDSLAHLMPPPAPSTSHHLGSASPIPPLSPYGSIVSLASASVSASASASSSTDTLDETAMDAMASSATHPSLIRDERFIGHRPDDELPLYNEPGHERAESVTSARSAAELTDAAAAGGGFAAGFAAGVAPEVMLQERKHRVASLAPLVFHLALHHHDANALAILRGQARRLASQIASVFPRDPSSPAYIEPGKSVLCMGGSLLGVEAYQRTLEEELASMGVYFGRSVVVSDPAKSGAVTLAKMWEAKMQHVATPA